jgi:hypothetical protein
LTADALTELSPDKTWGLVRGSGTEDYILADGRSFPMKTRWTATVVKNPEGPLAHPRHPYRHELFG